MLEWSDDTTDRAAAVRPRPWIAGLARAATAIALSSVLGVLAVSPVLAQEGMPVTPAGWAIVPRASDPIDRPDPASTGEEEATPPFPFDAPQVGPLIKRTYSDIVDRRTTAFLPDEPGALDGLTAIEMPETEEKWVRVDLSEQTLVAYQGAMPIRAFLISSGLPGTPTVTGTFNVRMKVRSQLMAGGEPGMNNSYYLPNVEWVQYFYEDYGLHGTYWHNDFGRPKSHGCVNMTNADAKWLWDWLGPAWDEQGPAWQRSTTENPGSLVIVHD